MIFFFFLNKQKGVIFTQYFFIFIYGFFSRQLTFVEISKETCLPIREVELLVMKALAQDLVHGAIDQVAGIVNMTWVQPRVLDRTQISGMVQQLEHWCIDVNSMETLLESRASEILTL